MRGATPLPRAIDARPGFQSTHPLRGATGDSAVDWILILYFNPRTPCGVRPACAPKCAETSNFNPRTPCGVRPNGGDSSTMTRDISIHAPLAGCDDARVSSFTEREISIHAPLAGCDLCEYPGRVRLYRFQSTHPLRGATRPIRKAPGTILFQSTHPLRGATRITAGASTRLRFQSTHPLRGAT